MKITRKNYEWSITLNTEEYIEIATQANKTLPYDMMYDIDEIIASVKDEATITQYMLDEGDFGFFMWSNDFWSIISRYITLSVGITIHELEMEVQI